MANPTMKSVYLGEGDIGRKNLADIVAAQEKLKMKSLSAFIFAAIRYALENVADFTAWIEVDEKGE